MEHTDYAHIFGSVFDDCRINCPECGDQRKKKNQKTLSVTVEGNDCLFYCHHCHISGKWKRPDLYQKPEPVPQKVRAISVPAASDQGLISDYLTSRSINPESVADFQVVSGRKYFNGVCW